MPIFELPVPKNDQAVPKNELPVHDFVPRTILIYTYITILNRDL